VICLCAQFEAVLQHGLRKSRGLALTAAALKQAAGFNSKSEAGASLKAAARSVEPPTKLRKLTVLMEQDASVGSSVLQEKHTRTHTHTHTHTLQSGRET